MPQKGGSALARQPRRHRQQSQLPAEPYSVRMPHMGAKYTPSVKDLKAGQRYQNNQQRKARAHAPATTSPQPVRPAKKSDR